MPLFFVYFWFFFFITYIHSFNHNTFIRRHSLKPLSISSSLVCSVGKASLWCRAENWTRACLTANRRAANWATPHHAEPRRTILSHAAPYWATLHHNWATPHHNWATPHHNWATPHHMVRCLHCYTLWNDWKLLIFHRTEFLCRRANMCKFHNNGVKRTSTVENINIFCSIILSVVRYV